MGVMKEGQTGVWKIYKDVILSTSLLYSGHSVKERVCDDSTFPFWVTKNHHITAKEMRDINC